MLTQTLRTISLLALLIVLGSRMASAGTCDQPLEPALDGGSAAGPGDWLELGVVAAATDGSGPALDRYGAYPASWLTSGVLTLGGGAVREERFELRWLDVGAESGRIGCRISYRPGVLDWDGMRISNQAWYGHGVTAVLQEQQVSQHRLQLQLNTGGLARMRFGFESGTWDRGSGALQDYGYKRGEYQNNFTVLGKRVHGQFKTTAEQRTSARPGGDSDIATAMLKLDGELGQGVSANLRASSAKYSIDGLDQDAAGADVTFGLRWQPTAVWELDASYRNQAAPDDNAVTSHLSGFDELGLVLSAHPGKGNRYELGYAHRNVDFIRLRSEDPAVETLLEHATQAVAPAQLAGHYDQLGPRQDHYWLTLRQQLAGKLTLKSRLDYYFNDAPQSTTPVTYSPSLFSDKRFKHAVSLSYNYNPGNQFGFSYYGQKAYYSSRDTDYGLMYFEGSWLHHFTGGGELFFAYRESHSDLDIPTLLNVYNTDDKIYCASFSRNRGSLGYALDFTLTDGTGYEEYRQSDYGASLKFNKLGPLGLRIDWIDKQYDNAPGLDGEALQLALTYKIDF